MGIIKDSLLVLIGAIGLLIIVSFIITGLAILYQQLLERLFKNKVGRPDLIPVLARFSAVATLALLLVLILGWNLMLNE